MQQTAVVNLLMNGFMQRRVERMAFAHSNHKLVREGAVVTENRARRQTLSSGLCRRKFHEVIVGLEDQQDQWKAGLLGLNSQVIHIVEKDLLDRFHKGRPFFQTGIGFAIELFWERFRQDQANDIAIVGKRAELFRTKLFRQPHDYFGTRDGDGVGAQFSLENLRLWHHFDPTIGPFERHCSLTFTHQTGFDCDRVAIIFADREGVAAYWLQRPDEYDKECKEPQQSHRMIPHKDALLLKTAGGGLVFNKRNERR